MTPQEMHRGELVPRWVFKMMPSKTNIEDDDNMESYQRHLICAITGKFVLIEHANAGESESLVASLGRPRPGVHY